MLGPSKTASKSNGYRRDDMSKFPRFRNARFWVPLMHATGVAKITLKPGQRLHHEQGGPDEEGYHYEGETWFYNADAGYVQHNYVTAGKDCDGRSGTSNEYRCLFPLLQSGVHRGDLGHDEGERWSTIRINLRIRPDWVRDEFAQYTVEGDDPDKPTVLIYNRVTHLWSGFVIAKDDGVSRITEREATILAFDNNTTESVEYRRKTPLMPVWENVNRSQRDHAAEAAGY